MTDKNCNEKLQNVEKFVENLEWDSHDGQRLRKKFPKAENISELNDYTQNWAKGICGKGYNTRALIVGIGGIGFSLFILSPCSVVIFFFALLVCGPGPPPHGI